MSDSGSGGGMWDEVMGGRGGSSFFFSFLVLRICVWLAGGVKNGEG